MVDGRETIVNGTYQLVDNPSVLPVWKWFTAPVEVLASSDGPLVIFVVFLSVFVGGFTMCSTSERTQAPHRLDLRPFR
jgi:hypothetical protein